jgi:hypothetical protein
VRRPAQAPPKATSAGVTVKAPRDRHRARARQKPKAARSPRRSPAVDNCQVAVSGVGRRGVRKVKLKPVTRKVPKGKR